MSFNFLYVADNMYYNLMRISMISSVKYHNGAIFHVFTMDSPETKQVQISQKNKEKLEREIASLDPTAKILFYDVRGMYLEKLGNSVNKGTKFTPYAALRLLASYLVKEDMLLYLDADTIVNQSLSALFTDHEDKAFEFAATKDTLRYTGPGEIGFLSGLLLLNLRYQRQTNYRFANNTIRYYNTVEYEYPDQDAIVAAARNTITLDCRYLQYYYDTDIKVVCVAYRNIKPVAPFLHQSIFHWDATRIYDKTERIAQAVSDIQNQINERRTSNEKGKVYYNN